MVGRCQFPTGLKQGEQCSVCHWTIPHDSPAPMRRWCKASKQREEYQPGRVDSRSADRPAPRLGDYTERLLSSIGVTQDRYKAAKELFGLAPTCNCDKRKAWLNRVGEWWLGS